MRKNWIKPVILAVATVLMSIPLTAIATEKRLDENETTSLREEFTTDEQKMLESINPAYTSIPEVLELKEKGYLDELTAAIDDAYASTYKTEMESQFSNLSAWSLTPEMTVAWLAEITQEYLDKNKDGIRIDRIEFQHMVKEMFYGDSYPLAKMAKDDPEFGAPYLYICIYYYENFDVNLGDFKGDVSKPLKSETMTKTLEQMFEEDFDRNFRETTTMEIFHKIKEKYLAKAAPENPLDGKKIQLYNTKEYVTQSADCTNFASQTLFYGGLAKTFYESDKTFK